MKGCTVLIIDDAEDVHTVAGTYLELSGYRVAHALNGALGLQIMKEQRPDLILLDVQMPVMDGFQTLEAIKRTPDLAEIPVLVLSSLNRPNLKVKGLQLGADDYIVKPFDQAELMARVDRAVQRSVRSRRLESELSGDFARVSFEELLQTLGLGRRTARIEFRDLAGEIVLLSGRLLDARWRDFEGEAAFGRLLFLAHGRFVVDFENVPPGDIADGATAITDLLLSTTVYLDEVRKTLQPQLDCDRLLEPHDGDPKIDFGGKCHPHWPATVATILACMAGELKENAAILIHEVDAGALRIMDPEGD